MAIEHLQRAPLFWRGIAAAALLFTGGLSSCKPAINTQAPPRASDTFELPPQYSTIAVPVRTDLSVLERELEKAVPRELWTVDQPDTVCVASSKVKVLFVKLKTPAIKCDIVGQVSRGALTLSGSGRDIVVTMPIHAEVQARDIAGILKHETATGDARVRAVIHLDIDRDWNPKGTIAIAYDWTQEPGIEFLGQRIEFTSKADAKLKGVIAKLERALPGKLDDLGFRSRVESAWRQAFTSILLNRENPPVWMRIAPRRLQFGGYAIEGRSLVLRLGMEAQTTTYVGERPADPPPIPLPPRGDLAQNAGQLLFVVPVIADWDQMNAVLQKALVKRARRPFNLPGLGPIAAQFGRVTIYGTTGNKLAVGIAFSATPAGRQTASHGVVWLTGTPTNQPNSRKVNFSDLSVSGVTDGVGTDLLIALANSSAFSSTIADALTQNFEGDFAKLMGKINRVVTEKRVGDFVIEAKIDDVRTGLLKVAGRGVFLPVEGSGTATITLAAR
ncbi:MAG: DUF4403 family protein [Novosphingobium sp.]